MKATLWLARSLCPLTYLVFSGCYTPGPYSYGTYPGYYAAPPQGYPAPPGGFVAPPGGAMPPGGMVAPGTTFPSPSLGPSQPTPNWSPSSPGPGPGISPTPALPPQGSLNGPSDFSNPTVHKPNDITVPEPTADPGIRRPAQLPARPSDDNSSPFGSESSQPTFDTKGTQMPVPQKAGGPESVAATGADSFESPLPRGGHPGETISTEPKTADARSRDVPAANPYDYDHTSYSYLRGVVDYDQRTKAWQVIYNPNPDPRDPYGGAFELVDHPKLSTLHSGDFVFVQGRVNPDKMDRRNKPKYEIHGEDIARITYRGTQSMGN